MVFFWTPFTPLLWLATAGIAAVFGIGAGVWDVTHWKRDGAAAPGERVEHSLIYHFNTTALRGRDVHRLQDLQMEVMPSGVAFFSVAGEFNVSGEVTGLHSKPHHGLRKGHLSFAVPGVFPAPVEATWYAIPNDPDDAPEDQDEKVEEAFHRVREMHKAAREHVKTTGEGEEVEFGEILASLPAA